MGQAKTVEELIEALQALPNQKAKLSRELWIGKDARTYKELTIDVFFDDSNKTNDAEWALITLKE